MDAYTHNRVIVEGNPSFEEYFGVPYIRQGKQLLDNFHNRPLKRLSAGDAVLVGDTYKRFDVVATSDDGMGLLVEEDNESGWGHFPPIVVEFGGVRVPQVFSNRDGGTTFILLRPDFRGIGPKEFLPAWGDGSKNGWDTWTNKK